jgi:ESF2/ABP1 family protein
VSFFVCSLLTDGTSPKRRRLDDGSASPSPHNKDGPVNASSSPKPNSTDKSKKRKVLRESDLADSQSAISKTGVVYLSRIPPRLTPQKIRQLLAPFGSPVLRVFLAPESTEEYTRRTKAGGSKRKRFTEGWIEFEDKRVAKRVAENLNAERIGQKKGDFLYDDLWCLKYLPKFKWHHLNEQIGMTPQVVLELLICSVSECFEEGKVEE